MVLSGGLIVSPLCAPSLALSKLQFLYLQDWEKDVCLSRCDLDFPEAGDAFQSSKGDNSI
jgi:hypothetical protein